MKAFDFFNKVTHNKNGKSRCSLMTLLSLCFFSFSLIMLIMLWMFQAVFLGSFYKAIKTKNITNCAHSIEINIDNDSIYNLIDYLAEKNDMCIVLCLNESSGNCEKIYTANSGSAYTLKNISSENIINYYNNTKSNDGSFISIEEHTVSESSLILPGSTSAFTGVNIDNSPDTSESIVYSLIFTDEAHREYMLLVDATVTPTTSMAQTLRYQLHIVTLIFVLVAVIITMVFSRIIAKPLENMNKTAKELAEGNYNVVFNGTGYKEVEQLSNTMNYATDELSQVDQMRKDLIANVSHDLRTPLTLITGYGEVMRDIPGENTAENIQIIIDEATRLSSLVSDLIDISKIEAGTMKLEATTFCITKTIEEMFGRYNKLKEQDGYSFTFEHDQDVYVYADQLKISQVIYNLVNNAVNYSGDSKAIKVRQFCYDNRVRIEVIDNGPGIPQEKLKNIWDRYYKVDKSHRSAKIGTGLGLSIVKTVLKLHKANFGVFSTVGKGTTFWFELVRTNKDGEPLT